jgi:transposase InsO family protein
MHYHCNATTNQKQRVRLRSSPKSCRALAEEMAVSVGTVHRWKHRDSPEDRSCRRKSLDYAFDEHESALILLLRRQGLALDDLTDSVQVVLTEAKRATIHRLLVRHGVSRLPKKEQQESGQTDKHGQFKDYPPGFLHVDCFYLPKLEGKKRYCFVAIDRATRLSFLAVYEHKTKEAATDFLKRCLDFFPFQITKVLTDNGREFTLHGFKNRYGTKVKTVHPFDAVCQALGIEHRLTQPYTPKTNGMVERMNGLTKEATTKVHRYETSEQMLDDLHGWFVRYNFCRKNRRLGGKTPYEACLAWFAKQPELFIKEPTAHLAFRS